VSAPASLGWLARHELRLAWRDALFMLRGGGRRHAAWAAVAVVAFAIVLHGIAYGLLHATIGPAWHPDKAFLLAMTGSGFLAWTLLLSQAMETVTRGFYVRADLDLILSSPVSAWRVFAVRIAAIAVTTIGMAALLAGPMINVAAALGGPRYLLGYGMLVAMGGSATAVAVFATVVLFRLVGAKRARLVAQIVAAVVGAGFVVGIQAAAIVSQGSFSRFDLFRSPRWVAAAPDLASLAWWPARAALGDPSALAAILGGALVVFAATTVWLAPAFATNALSVAGLPGETAAGSSAERVFRPRSRDAALRWKEWTLLRRDPWLVSQSLMQLLYLLPPALMLWHNFGAGSGGLVMLVPVLVMAAGQLAGGLAWLALSGEDAPDLVASAPIAAAAVTRAKIASVMGAVALPILPIALAMAFAAPVVAAIALAGSALAGIGASLVQLVFKAPSSRSQFRRRQTASRVATFAEAFLSISVAAAAGLAAGGLWLLALAPLAVAVAIPLACRAILGRPR
jgi:ABC-2 type transport system permease protein